MEGSPQAWTTCDFSKVHSPTLGKHGALRSTGSTGCGLTSRQAAFYNSMKCSKLKITSELLVKKRGSCDMDVFLPACLVQRPLYLRNTAVGLFLFLHSEVHPGGVCDPSCPSTTREDRKLAARQTHRSPPRPVARSGAPFARRGKKERKKT